MNIDEIVKSIDDSDTPLQWLLKYTDILPDDIRFTDAVSLAWNYAAKELVSLTIKAVNK